MRLPDELLEKIYIYYIPLYMNKMNLVHIQLLHEEHFLNLSTHLFHFDVDYVFAEPIPALI